MVSFAPRDPYDDPFHPPAISTLVHCLHCNEEYDSFLIEWRVLTDSEGHREGFWCCPMPGCDGLGFGFDLLPVDPNYRDENGNGWYFDDDEEEDEEDGEGEIASDDPSAPNTLPPFGRRGSFTDQYEDDIPF